MITGIVFVLRTGLPWRDLPREFGPWSSVYTRFRRWCRSGLWEKILALLGMDACGSIRFVDCTHIKVHQHAANAAGGAVAQAIGRTKGGPNTKLAAVVDGLGRATGLSLAPGNRNDLRAVAPLIDKMADCAIVGDRGFDAGTFRRDLLAVGARPCIPPRCSSKIQHYYSELLYAKRHVVENFFARIKRLRRVATRYEKLSETFLGFVTLAAVLDWLHFEV
jgi:transposase